MCRNTGQLHDSRNKSRRPALTTERERSNRSKKERLSHPVFFSISVLPSLQASVLIILPEPTAQAEGRETRRNRGGSVTSEGKRRVALAAGVTPMPLPSRERSVCVKGNTGHCFSGPLKWQSKSQKLIFFPPHSNDQTLPAGQRKGATSWLDTSLGPRQAIEDPSHTFQSAP